MLIFGGCPYYPSAKVLFFICLEKILSKSVLYVLFALINSNYQCDTKKTEKKFKNIFLFQKLFIPLRS